MNKMMNTAKTLDKVLHVLEILIKVLFVASLVGSLVIGCMMIFDVDPATFGEVDYSIGIGDFVFEVTEANAPSVDKKILIELAALVILLPSTFIGIKSLQALRKVMQAMAAGNPFRSDVSKQIKKLAIYSIVIGVIGNISKHVVQLIAYTGFDLKNVLVSEKIASVTLSFNFDLTFLIAAFVILLLSYVFAYGEQLQKLSDETL